MGYFPFSVMDGIAVSNKQTFVFEFFISEKDAKVSNTRAHTPLESSGFRLVLVNYLIYTQLAVGIEYFSFSVMDGVQVG